MQSEIRPIVKLALPIVLTQVGLMMLGLVDTVIVGHVGEQALAAVSVGNTLCFACVTPAFGIVTAVEPIAAQALGEGDRTRAWSARRESLRLALVLALPTMLAAWLAVSALPHFDVAPETIAPTRAYVLARMPSFVPMLAYFASKTYQQAAARPRASVEAALVANVVHAITGYVAVHGDEGLARLHLPRLGIPAFGAAGAGIATSASSWLMALWLVSPRGAPKAGAIDAPREGDVVPTRIDRDVVRKLVAVGTPIGLQFFAEVAVFTLVTVWMASVSARAAAAHQIALGLANFSFMGALGVAQATSVRVGRSIGEGSTKGARRAGFTGIAIGVAYMAAWGVVFAAAPRLLAHVFSNDAAVLDAAVPLVRLAALFQIGDGAQVCSAGALRGAGDTRWPLLANLVAHWAIAMPIARTLGFTLHWGAPGLWCGLVAGLWSIGIALVFRFSRLTRREIVRL
jgi:MATE family multidrug resistance protein